MIFNGDSFVEVSKMQDRSVDLCICDSPYGCTSHTWDKIGSLSEYNTKILDTLYPKMKEGGTLYLFGKHNLLDFMDWRDRWTLMTRIIWHTPYRLSQSKSGYTDNYDTIAYFVCGKNMKKANVFNLDDVRVSHSISEEQKKRVENVPSVSEKYKKTKYNPLGKNPSNYWDIIDDVRQLTYKSKEMMQDSGLHGIQKPKALIERLIRASSNVGDFVLDPFAGTGTTGEVCIELDRKFIGYEMNPVLCGLANERLGQKMKNEIKYDNIEL